METFNQIKNEIIAQVQGGLASDESKFDDTMVESLINQARADLVYPRRTLPEVFYQPIELQYISKVNAFNNCYVEFLMPMPLTFANNTDGIRYLGHPSGDVAYSRRGKSTTSSIYMAHKLIRNKTETMWVATMDTIGQWRVKVYNNPDVEELLVIGAFYNPIQVPNFRKDVDPYPIDGDTLSDVKRAINQIMMQQQQIMPNVVSTDLDKTAAPRR